MGTNYYWHNRTAACEHCGHSDEPELHIGKSSAGWVFHLRAHPEYGITDLPDWVDRFYQDSSVIRDEYGRAITPTEMLAVILVRFKDRSDKYQWTPDDLVANHARLGPMGLAAAVDSKPGFGTYSITEREFS